MENYVKDYIDKLQQGLRKISPQHIAQLVDALEEARIQQKMIFIIGNGGSAATASHMANDLQKLASKGKVPAFRAIALTDNVPLMTAWANDEDYTAIFVRQLEALASQGDILIAITGSGNSPNIVRSMKWAQDNQLKTIALLGFNGGKAGQIADHVLLFAENHYGRVEDAHMILEHMIANYLADMS
jgi:D-sedoheptulose 7-phosphate isomerase